MVVGENCAFSGCLFCKSGFEIVVAQRIEKMWLGVRALAVEQQQHQSRNGIKSITQKVMLPGYVFLYADKPFYAWQVTSVRDVYRLLRNEKGNYQLLGQDARFAQWILERNGVIDMSLAMREGDSVRVVHGPLKDLEGSLIRIDKKRRNGLVSIQFDQTEFRVWLAFEWLEDREKDAMLLTDPQSASPAM